MAKIIPLKPANFSEKETFTIYSNLQHMLGNPKETYSEDNNFIPRIYIYDKDYCMFVRNFDLIHKQNQGWLFILQHDNPRLVIRKIKILLPDWVLYIAGDYNKYIYMNKNYLVFNFFDRNCSSYVFIEESFSRYWHIDILPSSEAPEFILSSLNNEPLTSDISNYLHFKSNYCLLNESFFTNHKNDFKYSEENYYYLNQKGVGNQKTYKLNLIYYPKNSVTFSKDWKHPNKTIIPYEKLISERSPDYYAGGSITKILVNERFIVFSAFGDRGCVYLFDKSISKWTVLYRPLKTFSRVSIVSDVIKNDNILELNSESEGKIKIDLAIMKIYKE
jgi:hypothetical protein